MDDAKILIGWAKQDITPEKPVALLGQFHVRISQKIRDNLYVTVLALASENQKDHVIMISMDTAMVSDILRDEIRNQVAQTIKEINPQSIFINATHTHTAPAQVRPEQLFKHPDTSSFAMTAQQINKLITTRTVEAIKQAWASRKTGHFSHGIAPAVIGTNRRACYSDGSTIMYGDTSREDFIHNEGDCDHNANLLYTYDENKKLTGMIINIACPSQVTENLYEISADFWHDTRKAIAEKFGDEIYILPQCSAAGDQSPHVEMTPASQKRMLKLKYPNVDTPTAWRKEIAQRITHAAEEALPLASQDLHSQAILKHQCLNIKLPLWQLTQDHIDEAEKGVQEWQAKLDKIPADPIGREYSNAYARLQYYKRVLDSHKQRTTEDAFPTEIHIVKLGPIAFATNRFELLLDFGQRIKARSHAIQTFLVQLTGDGFYLPAARSCNSGYGATPMNGPVGPEGGDKLVEETVEHINKMFTENQNAFSDRY